MKSVNLFMVLFVWMIVGTTTAVRADDDQEAVAFGMGVHAYFDGHYDIASQELSQAIGDGTADPRPYFFRGLIHELQGQHELAVSDFKTGAEAEQSFVGKSFDVGESLERVQGRVRIEIEKYRQEAAVQAKEIRRKRNQEVDQSFDSKGRIGNAPFDPRNLPDVSQIIDATIPFPDVSAKPYFPPTKVVNDAAPVQIVPVTSNAPSQGPPTKAADNPFNTGNQSVPPAESKDMKEEGDKGQDPPPADDPFGGGNKDPGAGDSDANKDDGKEPDPSSGEEKKPDSKDDPFGGG